MRKKLFSSLLVAIMGGVALSGVTIKFVDDIKKLKNLRGDFTGQLALVKAGNNVAKYIYDGKYWLALNNANEIGLPTNGSLGNFKSCKEIKKANLNARDGMYEIDPDGEGGNAPFKVYCDMTTDGGGWTLAFVMDGSGDVRNMVFPNDPSWVSFTPNTPGTKTIGYPKDYTKLQFSEWRLTSVKHPDVKWFFNAYDLDDRVGRSLLNGPTAGGGVSVSTTVYVRTKDGKNLSFEHNNGGAETHDILTLGKRGGHVWKTGIYWGNIDSISTWGGILNTYSAHRGSGGGNTGDRLLIYLR